MGLLENRTGEWLWETVQEPLLRWFHREQRNLPWRTNPDPYAVWVSEIMLQQTQVATVIPYFERWMARFPTLDVLAAADEQDVLHAWQGLGYYSRARNLLYGAQQVVAEWHGRVPSSVPELLRLPGVGRYTAGAIASIAYNVSAPIVDGNVIRLLTRLFALRGDPAKSPLKGQLWELAEALVPEDHARNFNPALMELGATVCIPTKPRCDVCPLAGACKARELGIQELLPETAPRPQVTQVRMSAGVVRSSANVLLVQRRTDESRWPGMWEFPNVEALSGEASPDAAQRAVAEAVGLQVIPQGRIMEVRHSVTRYRITLEVFECHFLVGAPDALNCQNWRWVPRLELSRYALPKAHRTIADRLMRPGGWDAQLGLSIGA